MKTCKHGHVLTEDNICRERVVRKDGLEVIRERCRQCHLSRRREMTKAVRLVPRREPTLQELALASIREISWLELARRCGLSDVACRQRAKKLGMLDGSS